jgi:hypothetical protein
MTTHVRRIKRTEWDAYAPVREQEGEWGRPTPETAEKVWLLVGADMKLEAIMAPLYPFADPTYLETVAKRALVVILDAFVRAGRQHTRVSRAQALDGLAQRWSRTFWAVKNRSGARGVRFMRRATPGLVNRDLLHAGIQFKKLWTFATGCAALYGTTKVTFSSYQPTIQVDEAGTLAFERLVLADTSYRGYEGAARVLLASHGDPAQTVRQKVIAEVPYNVAETGSGSARVFALTNAVRLQVVLGELRRDYEAARHERQTIQRRLREQRVDATQKHRITKWAEGRGLQRWTSGRDRQIEAKPVGARETLRAQVQDYDRAAAQEALLHPILLQLASQEAPVLIKTGTQRAVNRRWHPTTFWPVSVSGKSTVWDEPGAPSMRGRWFRDRYGVEFVGMDISSSVTQIVAILTGGRRLERRTSRPGFNRRLAKRARLLHDRTLGPAGIFKNGYTDSDDRLRESVKNLWMTAHYGSTPWAVVHAQRENPRTYGPGYVGPTSAARLLECLPGSRDMAMFKRMCRAVARVAFKRDPSGGVLFVDPLDGTLFRWNTAAYKVEAISCAGGRIEIQVPGQWVRRVHTTPAEYAEKKNWLPSWLLRRSPRVSKVWVNTSDPDGAGRYRVNPKKLRKQVAPMLIHSLDALFSGLVIEELTKRGVQDFFAAHDAWYVPRTVGGRPGLDLLRESIEAASVVWYESLWSVYDRLDYYLAGHPEFGPYIKRMRAAWDRRIESKDWPSFAAAPVAGLMVHDVVEEAVDPGAFNPPRTGGDT